MTADCLIPVIPPRPAPVSQEGESGHPAGANIPASSCLQMRVPRPMTPWHGRVPQANSLICPMSAGRCSADSAAGPSDHHHLAFDALAHILLGFQAPREGANESVDGEDAGDAE